MPITLGLNISSLQAQRRLSDATSSASKIFEQLSSGLRINRASDDAAGLAVSEDLNLQTRVYSKAILNGNDAQSVLSIADSTLGQLGSVVMRIRELATQSANGTFGVSQRKSLDAEAQALSKEFFRISRSAEFNGLNLFDGSLADGIRFQLGFGTDGSIKSNIGGALGTGAITSLGSYNQTGTGGTDVAMGDLNGDGIIDMVTTGGTGIFGFATIRLGNGDGTFGTHTTLSSSSTTTNSVALGDINNDGILDLVTAGMSSGTPSATIFIGNGDGTFGASISYTTETGGSASTSVKLADLNSDGNLDLITSGGATGGLMSVRLGDGNGTFGSKTQYSTIGTNPVSEVSIGDLNSDGILDLVSIDSGRSGYTTFFLGNGNGTFSAGVSYNTGLSDGRGVTLGDLNGDGILDLVASGANGGVGRTIVQLGNGNGTFGTITSYLAEGTNSFDATLADMNGDGILDIITSGVSGADGYTSIRLGNGDGTFGTSVSYLSDTASSSAVTTADINGDGVLDIITAGTADGNVGSARTFLGNTRDGIAPILPFTLTTKGDSLQALSMLDKAMSNLSTQRGVIGAFQSRLGIAINNILTARDNFTAARSRITDVDVASASADLVRTQILQKASVAILAQANQSPKLALQLLQK